MSASAEETNRCPHCGHALSRVTMPEASGWQEPYHLACFNDECSYYVNGWRWMLERYRVRASYRYRVEPPSGAASPLPVWSSTAHRDRIVGDDATAAAPTPAASAPGTDRRAGGVTSGTAERSEVER